MHIENAVVLVTGANRGLGRVFVQTALARGARKVYAAARQPDTVDVDGAVPLRLDVTRPQDAAAAAALASDVTLVVNNAGISLAGGVAGADGLEVLRRQLDTNCLGLLHVAQAFAPVLRANGGGAMVNILSALSWVNAPGIGGYCVSKAAAWGLTNALRNELRGQGTLVVGLHAGFIDTDMARGFPGPKTPPASVAAQAFDAVQAGQEEVLADEPARHAQAALGAGRYLQALAFK
ncbi:SDR family oxidoreductase [Pseudorhodoferax sp. Leaf267]|uniref:SDR family oxidoreductase n=1 Tax=Pseudorhodoferax sp. Leaf267 TaxID=1736316 RepID=UPI0006FE8010|nr:SDR family oxidoreductase [Pseudorhodoferax sp. Leaf267]KQP13120.1 short-chain dehydrogenase [Pseudorhodoferax sp. Leaf267]